MRALLLAAGLGTRLRPLTNTIPKCLVPIKGKPLLQIWLEQLIEAGIDRFLINMHYLSEQVESFIEQCEYRNQVELVYEPELLGTAGTLISNLDFFQGQDGMLIHADNYCQADLHEFIRVHRQRPADCIMTMMTFRTDTPSSCGIVELNYSGVVTGFHEKVENPPGNLANGAVYILSAGLMEKMGNELNAVQDFSKEVLHRFIGRIYTYETYEVFMDIGTMASYQLANR